jgi:hypothetical protein
MATAPDTVEQSTATESRTGHGSSIKRLARVAGWLYVAIFVIYPLATAVRSTLVVSGDAATTMQNVAANETLFRWGMAGEATIVLIEIVLAAVLYVLLRPVSTSMSLAAALARASEGVVMAAGNLFTSIVALSVIGGAGYLTAFDSDQRGALVLLFQDANDYVVLMWGLFFALHLVVLGALVQRSGYLPKILGVLLVLAGAGYFAQSFGTLVAPGMSDVLSTLVLVLAVPGELAFALWLVVKGVDEDAWRARAGEARE